MSSTSPAVRRARAATRRRRLALGAASIVKVALDIVDREGVDAVSMRRVAAEFDTGPASLYGYFPNKEALLSAVFTRVLEELPLPEGRDWQDMLRRHMHACQQLYARHQDVARLSFGVVPQGERFVEIAERLLSGMLEGGVPAQVAAWAMDVTALYAASDAYEGFLMGQMFDDGSGRQPEEVAGEYFGALGRSLRDLPSQRYPAISAHVDEMLNGDGQQRYAFGVDVFIAGIAAMIPR